MRMRNYLKARETFNILDSLEERLEAYKAKNFEDWGYVLKNEEEILIVSKPNKGALKYGIKQFTVVRIRTFIEQQVTVTKNNEKLFEEYIKRFN